LPHFYNRTLRRRVKTAERGIEFHFFFAKSSDAELHITAAHGTTPDEAVTTYFNGITEFDDTHRRFITMSATHTLFWSWIEKGASVYVITCVRAGEQD